jgi:hypothetical protein
VGGKKEQLFLNLRREMIQLQDLAEPSVAHMPGLGQLPIVSDRASGNQIFEANRERHQAADPRRTAFGRSLFSFPAHARTNGNRQAKVQRQGVF